MKLGKLALVGALTLGGFTAAGTINTTSASAATVQNPADSWGITDTWILNQHIEPMPPNYKKDLMSSYKTLNWVTVNLDWSSSLTANDQVKIFRVLDDGTLSRYKTINWENFYDYQAQKQIAVWQTQITDAYLPGTYVAVSYINGKHFKSDFFTINK
ncbi:DUF5065 family protein [Bacillus sp. FSL M7-0996]|uniref:DUF5065 family protein n=1 Tax=Bacillus sp. FSL M7-0996 TaxID=2921538 RepID=UPI0030F9F6C8